MKVVFIDRDGTLIWEPPDTKQVDSLKKFRILPDVVKGLLSLKARGFTLVMVSNQDGLGTKSFPLKNFFPPHQALLKALKKEGIVFKAIFISPDLPGTSSLTRKPATGLVDDFIRLNKISLKSSLVIGDRKSDRKFAKNLGTKFIKVKTNRGFPKV